MENGRKIGSGQEPSKAKEFGNCELARVIVGDTIRAAFEYPDGLSIVEKTVKMLQGAQGDQVAASMIDLYMSGSNGFVREALEAQVISVNAARLRSEMHGQLTSFLGLSPETQASRVRELKERNPSQ